MSTEDSSAAAEAKVKEYLDSFASDEIPTVQQFPRVACCKPSQSLYCKECCRLVVPDDALPAPIRLRKAYICNGDDVVTVSKCCEEAAHDVLEYEAACPERSSTGRPFRLPFNLHVIVDDRRGSSTGIHAIALLGNSDHVKSTDKHELLDGIEVHMRTSCQPYNELGAATLTDVEKLDPIEQSEILENALEIYDDLHNDKDGPSTYFLFPCPGESVPLEEVSDKVKTLIVLDCKWTKSGVWRRSERLRNIPKVHLSNPPEESHFWRWHNAGKGMMSTIEAIYYAALEVHQSKCKQMLMECAPQSQLDEYLLDEQNLIHLLWLFGQQRLATMEQAKNEGKAAPCCEDGKEMQRALRRRKISWRPK